MLTILLTVTKPTVEVLDKAGVEVIVGKCNCQ